jgi:hypothetical protein
VRVTRKGGLAGLTLAADLDTDEPAVERALEQLTSRGQPSGPPHPDGFEYHFELPGRPAVAVPDHELPRELDPLLDDFAKRAAPGG